MSFEHHTRLYSIQEATRLLGIGRTVLYREIKEGKLKAQKCGRRTLISAQAIDQWIAALPKMQEAR